MMNLNELREKLEAMQNGWYGRMSDITEELEDLGVDLDCAYVSREYVSFSVEDEDGEDHEAVLRLGGTERTITVDSVEFD